MPAIESAKDEMFGNMAARSYVEESYRVEEETYRIDTDMLKNPIVLIMRIPFGDYFDAEIPNYKSLACT